MAITALTVAVVTFALVFGGAWLESARDSDIEVVGADERGRTGKRAPLSRLFVMLHLALHLAYLIL